MDTITTQVAFTSKEITPAMSSLLVYKLRVRWLYREELQQSEMQYLTTYFENKLKIALSRERRFAIYSGHDLKTLAIKATDSSLQVKNTYSEEQLREYAKARNIDGILSVDVLISESQVVCYLSVNDLNSLTIWSREYRANYAFVAPDYTNELNRQLSLRKKTGYPVSYFTLGFRYSDVSDGVPENNLNKKIGFASLGYRYNDMATIVNKLTFWFETKVFYSMELGTVSVMAQPGLAFELVGNETIGPQLLVLDGAYGYHVTLKEFSPAYTVGLTSNLSRIISISLHYTSINAPSKVGGAYQPSGGAIGVQVNFIM